MELYSLPSLKELDKGVIHESELTASFVHPLLKGLFATNYEDRVAHSYVLSLPHLFAIFFLIFHNNVFIFLQCKHYHQ